MLDVAGDTVTDATGTGAGALTVTDAVPVCPSLEAVIVAAPAVTPVTRPALETVAIAALELVHDSARPLNTLPFASRVTAVSCEVAPINMLELDGETVTLATGIGDGALTVKKAEPLCPSLVALIAVVPAASAETSPFAETEATFPLEVCQVTTRPESELPFASRSVAVARAVCRTTNDDGLSATDTVATGIGSGVRTVSEAWPVTPSVEAMMRAAPGATAATMPESLTLALCGFELCQLMARFSGEPFASRATATPCSV